LDNKELLMHGATMKSIWRP